MNDPKICWSSPHLVMGDGFTCMAWHCEVWTCTLTNRGQCGCVFRMNGCELHELVQSWIGSNTTHGECLDRIIENQVVNCFYSCNANTGKYGHDLHDLHDVKGVPFDSDGAICNSSMQKCKLCSLACICGYRKKISRELTQSMQGRVSASICSICCCRHVDDIMSCFLGQPLTAHLNADEV